MNPTVYKATAIPTHFGAVKPAAIGPTDRNFNQPIEYHLSYINNFPVPVTVVWRSGLKFTLQPEPSLTSADFVARVSITMDSKVKVDIARVLSAVTEESSMELKAMRQAFEAQVKVNTYGGAKIVLDHSLSLQRLQEMGGTVYYSEHDAVVSILPFDQVPPHPYSPEGMQQQVVAGALGLGNENTFGYVIEIIDNHAKYGDRYLNICNKVYRISPKKDWERQDGIYVVSNYAVEGELGMSGRHMKNYSFEQAEELLGLYRTYEEALNFGDVASGRKLQIAELEHEVNVGKRQLQEATSRHQLEMLEKEKQLKELLQAHERHNSEVEALRSRQEHELKLERDRLKDFYENRSYERKDQSESLKFLPSLVIGIGAIFMAIKTFATTGKVAF
jgi:hypothetical protein